MQHREAKQGVVHDVLIGILQGRQKRALNLCTVREAQRGSSPNPVVAGTRFELRDELVCALDGRPGDFLLEQEGTTPVLVTEVRSGCGCTVMALEKNLIQPGEKGKIQAVYHLESRQGRQSVSVAVTTQEPEERRYDLTVEVEINFPGANAETVEESIATAVEQEVNGAENMIYFSSKSTSDGRYVLTCTFKVGTNLDLANVDINNRVNKAQPKLPPEAVAAGISVKKKSPDMLVVLSLHSPEGVYDDLFLSNYASINLVDPLARVQGVGSTMIVGQRDYSMRFWVRPDRLAALGITAGDLSNAVKEQNLVVPAGAVGQPPARAGTEFQLAVNVKGRLETPEEFENIVVRTLPDG